MAIKLVAALIVLLFAFSQPDLARFRDFAWFRAWLAQLHFAEGGGRLAIALAVPVIVCALLAHALHGWVLGFAGVAFAVLVLIYTLGPREPEEDIDAVLTGDDAVAREAVAQRLRSEPAGAPRAFSAPELVEAATLAALRRRFGVLFWFFLLGPAGALVYRLARVAADSAEGDCDARTRHAARRFAAALDWAPAHRMVLAMALVSDFDAVLHAWRAWHAQPGRSGWELEPGFLAAVARAGVDADVQAGDGWSQDTRDPLVELSDARHLLLRVLIVWLAVVALIVLAGWFT